MAEIIRKEITLNTEKLILTSLITNDDFCKATLPLLNYSYFKTKPTQKIAKWVKEYYQRYNQSPKSDIKEIFFDQTELLDTEDTEILHNILSNLDTFDEQQNNNVEYLKDKAVNYFKRRAVELTKDSLDALVSKGKIDEAEQVIKDYKKVSRVLTVGSFFEMNEKVDEVLKSKFNPEIAHPDDLFTFDGRLGEFIGPLRRGWLIGVLAGYKKGKSWLINELALSAVSNYLNVFYVSLEMSEAEVISRFIDRITAIPNDENGKFLFPTFDCMANQDGSCNNRERKGMGVLLSEGNAPPYEEAEDWQPCIACRGYGSFIPTAWYFKAELNNQTYKQANNKLKAFLNFYKKRMRIAAFPRGNAALIDIERAIDDTEYSTGFIPDVIIVDYLDITKPENGGQSGRDQSDSVWKAASALAAKRRTLVVTPIQANKVSRKKRWIESGDVSEDQRKLQHAEVTIGLNQTDDEKVRGILRINTVIHRFRDYEEKKGATVLQNLHFGQSHLDSEF